MVIRNPDTSDNYSHEDAGLLTYEADWYSGSQIQVLMGDIVIDNAVAISYQLNSNRIPIFGFGSEYFAFTAKGHTLITGQLTITFKETQYILKPALRYHNLVGKKDEDNLVINSARGATSNTYSSLSSASGAAHRKRNTINNIETNVI